MTNLLLFLIHIFHQQLCSLLRRIWKLQKFTDEHKKQIYNTSKYLKLKTPGYTVTKMCTVQQEKKNSWISAT